MSGTGGRLPVIGEGYSEVLLEKGRFRARVSRNPDDLLACYTLRGRCFQLGALDRDPFDSNCRHVLIETTDTGELVGCFRLLLLDEGGQVGTCYSSQYYDLTGLSAVPGRSMEMGRFCIDPDCRDVSILRLAWGAITKLVDHEDVGLLFGCTSFAGTDATAYLEAFALLQYRYLAPEHLAPAVKSGDAHSFAELLQHRKVTEKPNLKQAQTQLPPLLRSYLAMGGWVSDHVVVDTRLNTCHVFTGLEVHRIPAARKRLLRDVAENS